MTYPNNANQYLPGTIAIPSSLDITAMTQSYPMIATVVIDDVTQSNTYIPGQLVRLTVPKSYGMFQANQLTLKILMVVGNDLYLDIDSTYFDPFVVPMSTAETPASLAPAGSRNLEFNNSTNQVPFQSLNNRGN